MARTNRNVHKKTCVQTLQIKMFWQVKIKLNKIKKNNGDFL